MNVSFWRIVISQLLVMSSIIFLAYYTNAQSRENLLSLSFEDTDTTAAITCYDYGKKVFATSMDSALMFFEKGAEISERHHFTRGKILNWRSMGAVLGRMGRYEDAIDILEKGLILVEEEQLPIVNRVDFLINIGAAHHFAGFTGRAIETYITAVDFARKHGLDDKRSMLLNNLGIFYRTLNRHEEAIAIYEESIDIRTINKDTAGLAGVKHNMAAAYYKIKNYGKALENYNESRKLYTDLKSSKDLLINQIAVGEVLTAMGNYNDAIKTLQPLLIKNEIAGIDHTTKYTLFGSISRSYMKQNKFQQALETLNQIEPILESSDLSPQRLDFYELKANVLTSLDRHAEANIYLKKYIKESSDQSKQQSDELLKEMETKYLSVEKDHEISLLNSKSEIQNLQLKEKNRQLIYSGLGLVLAMLSLYGFYLAYRTKIKTNKSLQDKNIQLQEALESNKMLIKIGRAHV